MSFNLTTVLGVTGLLILVAIMLRNSEGTNTIIRGIADSYTNAVNAFPIK